MNKFITVIRRTLRPFWVALNTLMAGICLFTGYAGCIDPDKMPFAGLAVMSFPWWYVVCAILLIINLILSWRIGIINLVALLGTLKPFLVFCPLNCYHPALSEEEQMKSFKVTSYNILSFVDVERNDYRKYNRTLHEVIHCGADAVILLEYDNLDSMEAVSPAEQVDSLRMIYPYFLRGGRGTVCYSKRPIRFMENMEEDIALGSVECFITECANRPIMLIGVHLESYRLNKSNKELYDKITDKRPQRAEVYEMREQILLKLYESFSNRKLQAEQICRYLDAYDGDVIICGDFNDVPNCYSLRLIEDKGATNVYSEVGCGPQITYNDPRFPFRIDHMLYRGQLRATQIEHGNMTSSDHYPLTTTFVWD